MSGYISDTMQNGGVITTVGYYYKVVCALFNNLIDKKSIDVCGDYWCTNDKYTVFQKKKTSTRIIGYKLRNSCLNRCQIM